MNNFPFLNKKTHHFSKSFYHALLFRVNPFWIHLCYFITLSLVGYLGLKVSKPKTGSFRPRDIDVVFTSVSAAAVSSMSTVEMEVFSNTQLVILTILMAFGGEVFTSMLGLQFTRSKFYNRVDTGTTNSVDEIELGSVTRPQSDVDLKYSSIKCLGYVVLSYLLVVHVAGISLIALYISFVDSAKEVIEKKGISIQTFSVFTIVSTFTNCGFIPTNENMMVFKKNTGLLLILIPQILLGNTLYPVCLRLLLMFLGMIRKRGEFGYLLKNCEGVGYGHLMSGVRCWFLGVSVLGLVVVQVVVFWCLEWNSAVTEGLNSYEKVVGSLFQVVNSRHAGEYVFDLSTLSSAILVLFVLMMYLPPYTSFVRIEDDEKISSYDKRKKRRNGVEYLIFSQLSYLLIFILLICITEREKLKADPLNFNVLNITVEVISAYGNVGFSTGYSCQRQLKPDSYCKDAWYGFAGRWSVKGKILLIIVMIFGRLKKFNMEGGRAWKLS